MKKLPLILNVVLLLGMSGWLAASWLAGAVARGKCRRHGADVLSIARALEAYRAGEGAYPPAFGMQTLRARLEPEFMRTAPAHGMWYYSEGSHYDLWYHDEGPEGAGGDPSCVFHAGDGAWLHVPKGLDLPPIDEVPSKASPPG